MAFFNNILPVSLASITSPTQMIVGIFVMVGGLTSVAGGFF